MSKRSVPCTLLLLLFAAAICLALAVSGWVIFILPQQAEAAFGPPAEHLTTRQRILLSTKLILNQDILNQPADQQAGPVPFRIQLGESTYAISTHLQMQALIKDAAALRDYLVYAGLDTTLQAGDYTLSARMTPVEIAHALQDATPREVDFHILPGWRLEEVAAALPSSGLEFTPEAFLEMAAHPPASLPLVQSLPAGSSLEGFFFPDSYRLSRQISLADFLKTLLEDFQLKVDFEIQQGFQNQGLDLFQAVTLASIVQREAMLVDEMPLIASVFYNRLRAGMRLDADPTVQFALGFNTTQKTWWTNPLSASDLEIDSPYNTYRYAGLPPGPIANPGLDALRAVAFPAQTPYIYFRAACDGSGRHTFAETFEEHQGNACP